MRTYARGVRLAVIPVLWRVVGRELRQSGCLFCVLHFFVWHVDHTIFAVQTVQARSIGPRGVCV